MECIKLGYDVKNAKTVVEFDVNFYGCKVEGLCAYHSSVVKGEVEREGESEPTQFPVSEKRQKFHENCAFVGGKVKNSLERVTMCW